MRIDPTATVSGGGFTAPIGDGRSRRRSKATRLVGYDRAWAKSVPANQSPPHLAPSDAFLRKLNDIYPEVHLMWDPRESRKTFVLWEKTRTGNMVVIKDVPKGYPPGKLIDYLHLCSMSKQGGIQRILDAIDNRSDKLKDRRLDRDRKVNGEPDYDRIVWAARKDLSAAESSTYGINVSVPR